jgi:protein-disulfide isomerase
LTRTAGRAKKRQLLKHEFFVQDALEMRRLRPLSLVSAARSAVILAAAAGALAACSESAPPSAAGGAATEAAAVDPFIGDIVLGPETATVTIVEYASLTCPHCRDFWKQVFPSIRETYIDTGKVRYILRDFPTPPAKVAAAAAALARCKGEAGYYAVVDDVFTNFSELIEAAQSPQGAGPVLTMIGAKHGLSADQVRACANHPGVQKHIEDTVTEAAGRVRATPTLFINDEPAPVHSFAEIAKIIDAKLAADGG